MEDRAKIDKVIELVLADADDRAEAASCDGAHHDGGASKLRDAVTYYKLGRDGLMPTAWEKYEHMLDPEYAKYLELKRKFGE